MKIYTIKNKNILNLYLNNKYSLIFKKIKLNKFTPNSFINNKLLNKQLIKYNKIYSTTFRVVGRNYKMLYFLNKIKFRMNFSKFYTYLIYKFIKIKYKKRKRRFKIISNNYFYFNQYIYMFIKNFLKNLTYKKKNIVIRKKILKIKKGKKNWN